MLHYAASKCGVIGISQSLAKGVVKEGLAANAFRPGVIDTGTWAYNDAAWGKPLGDYKPGEAAVRYSRSPTPPRPALSFKRWLQPP